MFEKPQMKLVLLFIFITTSLAKESLAEKEKRRSLADKADIIIKTFKNGGPLTIDEIPDFLSKPGIKMILFSTLWCKFSQRFKPKYVEAIKTLISNNAITDTNSLINIKSVDCTKDEPVCAVKYRVEDGYPSIFIYNNGSFSHEYPDKDETKEFIDYVTNLAEKAKSPGIKVDESVPTHKEKEKIMEKNQDSDEEDDETFKKKESFPFVTLILISLLLFVIYRVAFKGKKRSRSGHYVRFSDSSKSLKEV